MNRSSLSSWNQQMLMLQKLTDADTVFLAEFSESKHTLIRASSSENIAFSIGKEIGVDQFCIYNVLKEEKVITENRNNSFFSTSPIINDRHEVWGVLVLIINRSPESSDDILFTTTTFCQIISDQINLHSSKALATKNVEPKAIDYFLKSIDGVTWRLNLSSSEFIYLGQEADNILGYTLDDWPNIESWSSCIHPDDREFATKYCYNRTVAGEDHVFEYRLVKKDNSVIWIRDIVKVIADKNGKPFELVGLMVDITHIKEKEHELAMLTSQIKYVLGATNTELSIVDENRKIIFHSHKDVSKISQNCHQHFAGLAHKCSECPRKNTSKSKSSFLYQSEGKTIHVIAYPFEVEHGVWHVAEVRIDVTERVENEKKISVLKDRLEFSMEAGEIAYLEYNLQTYFFRVNSVFTDITGFNFDEENVEIDWIKSRIRDEDIAYLLSSFNESLKTESKKIDVEFKFLVASNQYKWFRFSGRIIENELSHQQLAGVLIDISDTRELMDALLFERNRSMQASEAKSMFLANVSHEIRTPMNAIIGFSELLSKHIVEQPHHGYLNSIKASGNVLLALINDLLDLEKIEAGKMLVREENTDIVALLKEIEQTFEMGFKEKQINLHVKYQDGIPKMVLIDSLKIKQLLLNLVNNALKFTSHGEVVIQCAFKIEKEDEIGTLSIVVSDTGIGISQSKQEQVFEPFIQDKSPIDKDHQGTGLGLSIVQRLVRMMGGLISLESKENEGSTFSILIPNIKVFDCQYSMIEKVNKQAIKFNHEQILLIDKVQSNVEVLDAICSNLQLKCHTALFNNKLIDKIVNVLPRLIIMDMRPLKNSNFKFIQEIKNNEKVKDIPIIAVSSSSNSNEKKLALNAGFAGFVSKPISEAKLIKEIKRFITPLTANSEVVSGRVIIDNCTFSLKDKGVITEHMNNYLIPIWKELQEIMASEKLSLFVNKLAILCEQVKWPLLNEYISELNIAIQSYDFETIQKLLSRFHTFVNEVVN